MIFFILLTLILFITYLAFLYNKYQNARDKNQFIKSKILHSNLWLVLLIIVSVLCVNLFFPDKYSTGVKTETSNPEDSIDSYLSGLRHKLFNNLADPDVHVEYARAYFNYREIHSPILSFYDSLKAASVEDNKLFNAVTLGNAICYWNNREYKKALKEFDLIKDDTFPYVNYYLGWYNKALDKDSIAISYFKKENQIQEHNFAESYEKLIDIYYDNKDYDELNKILENAKANKYLSERLKKEIQFRKGDILGYYTTQIKSITPVLNFTGFLAALLITFIWYLYLQRISVFEKVDWSTTLLTFLLGTIFCFGTFLLSGFNQYILGNSIDKGGIGNLFMYSVLGIGAIEEFVKIVPLLLLIFFTNKVKEPYHYIYYASISALGFAFIENLIYFDGSYGSIIHGRSLTAVVGHMVDSSIIGYGLALGKRKKNRFSISYFIIFWFIASLVHGLYDFWLFANLFIFFIFFFILCIRIWIVLINNTLNNSTKFTYQLNFDQSKQQFYLVFALTVILMFEYIAVGWLEGNDSANQNIVTATFSGSLMIAFLGSKLSTLDFVKGYWAPVNLSINPFTDCIISQNFVGKYVTLHPYYLDYGLGELFPDGVNAKIIRRIILHKRQIVSFIKNADPYWFLVALQKPMETDEFEQKFALIKFKESYSSLNDDEDLMVHYLLIPKGKELRDQELKIDEFMSLGWAVLNEQEQVNG